MLFICDYRQPLNKRCLCKRSKVSADSELFRFFREESIEGRTPYSGRVAGGGLLQREGWKCSRWEIRDKTSNFSNALYHICVEREFILRWGVELTLNAVPYVWNTWDMKFWHVFWRKLPKTAKFGLEVSLSKNINTLKCEEKRAKHNSSIHGKVSNKIVTWKQTRYVLEYIEQVLEWTVINLPQSYKPINFAHKHNILWVSCCKNI